MIIDLNRFVNERQSIWDELNRELDEFEAKRKTAWDADRVAHLYDLYQKTCYDLAQAQSFASEPELIRKLETTVARAYAVIYRRKERISARSLYSWIHVGFPATFRKRFRYFVASFVIMAAGMALGGYLVLNEPNAKTTLFAGFEHLIGDPAERVKSEESPNSSEQGRHQASFSSSLMTNNIRVSFFALALGMTFGLGTVAILFYNGAILGGVCADYIASDQSVFLAGWLLPHGVIEIPAILIAGQAGLLLASALIGWKSPVSVGERMRIAAPEVAYLAGGVCLMLVWAGVVESYLSQTHEPQIAYSTKIAFGIVELILFSAFLVFSGSRGLSKNRAVSQ